MKEVDIEVQNNEDGLGYGFENPDAEPLKYRTRAERKAREEKNRKEANIVYENYKEYETEDDIAIKTDRILEHPEDGLAPSHLLTAGFADDDVIPIFLFV